MKPVAVLPNALLSTSSQAQQRHPNETRGFCFVKMRGFFFKVHVDKQNKIWGGIPMPLSEG